MSAAPTVLIVSAMRDEGPYIIDWLAHLIGAGVGDFIIYSNDCADGTDRMLDLLAGQGIVNHRPHTVAPGASVQWQAFRDAWKSDNRKRADWAMVCDVDEYPNLKLGRGRFADLFDALPEGADAVALPWRFFGSNGHLHLQDVPVPERFTASMTPDLLYPVGTTFFKTLLRCAGPFNQFGVHRPSQKDPARHGDPMWLDGSLQPLPPLYAGNAQRLSLIGHAVPGRDYVEMHHYSVRSAQEFVLKAARGLPHHRERPVDLAYWVERNFNTMENRSIARMAPATAQARAQLMALPGLAALHEEALAHHEAQAAALLRDERHYQLFTRAILAGDSREVSLNQTRGLYEMFHNLQT